MTSQQVLKKILIIQTAFLGDVILATGILHKLRLAYPQAQIDFLLKKENAHLLENHPDIDHLLLFDKSKKWKELLRLIPLVRKEKYDLVINLHRFASSGLLTVLANASATVGFNKNPLSFFYTTAVPHVLGSRESPFHEIQRNHSLIASFTDEFPARPYLEINIEVLKKTKEYRECEYVCIAPTSVWYTKQLTEEKWAGLMRKIPENITIYLMGGANDFAPCERIKNNARRNNVKILAGKLSMIASAAVMKDAIVNFVNDSAPTHLASAVDAAVCTVYCSTVPDFGFGPLATFSRIVETKDSLPCRPCNLHGYKNCPLTHFKCASTIDVEALHLIFIEAQQYGQIV
jgi:ADP-heptose:LPS heptosyltransferase